MPSIGSWIRFGLEEIKFLKSFKDLRIFYEQKLPFLVPRVARNGLREARVPLSLQLEPTNHCNLDCICCSRKTMKRRKGYMDFSLFQKIIDDAALIGVRRIHLYLHGESLLHPQIVRMISYIKSKGMGITLATNGMLLDREKTEAILQSGVNSADYIQFSILGHSKAVHERIMKGVNHEGVLESLFGFLRVRKRIKANGPIIETVFYRMPENQEEESAFVNNWSGIVDHVHPVGEISKQFASSKGNANSTPVRTKTCHNLWERMTVFWNGDVTRCIADLDGNYRVGSLKEKSITQIWNCDELSAIRRLHKKKQFTNLALCSNCDW